MRKHWIAIAAGMMLTAGCAACAEAEVSLPEQEIYNADGIVITATGIEEGFMGPEIKLSIDNGSGNDITVQTRQVAVNGYMQDSALFSSDVASGKKAIDSLSLSTSELDQCGIGEIRDLEFRIAVIDPDSWEDISVSDLIDLETTGAEDYVQEYDESGTVLYEDETLKLIGKEMTEEPGWGAEYNVYIENSGDETINVSVQNSSVNGYMADALMAQEVTPGNHAIGSITIFETDLENAGLTADDITELEVSFYVFDSEFNTVKEMDPVVITIE